MPQFYRFPASDYPKAIIDLEKIAYIQICDWDSTSKYPYGLRFVFHGIQGAGAGAARGIRPENEDFKEFEQVYELGWSNKEGRDKEFEAIASKLCC